MKTILLADDSITIQKVVELTFSEGEYQVFCVGNGALALKKMREVRPDIVLLDVVMPEKNGYEVCEQMKSDPATAGIPVLLLTGTFEPFDRRRADAAGATGHLTKPFESHTLVARVEELLAQGIEARETGMPSSPAPVERPAAPAPRAATPGLSPASAFAPATTPAPVSSFPPPMPPVRPPAQHAAFTAPEAAEGGSYMGFGDVHLEDPEEPVVPDRYDLGTPENATLRMSREEVLATVPPPERRPDPPPQNRAAAPEPMEGFMPGYEIPDGGTSRTTQRTIPLQPEGSAASSSAIDLPQETLDKLADIVVRKLSERVVREIAWEVIPGVAEAVVRQRIKELEESER